MIESGLTPNLYPNWPEDRVNPLEEVFGGMLKIDAAELAKKCKEILEPKWDSSKHTIVITGI